MARATKSVEEETSWIRSVLGAFFITAAAGLVWRAWTGLAAIGFDAKWASLFFIVGFPIAAASGLLFMGISIVWNSPRSSPADRTPEKLERRSTIESVLKLIGPVLIAIAPMFKNLPSDYSWSEFALRLFAPLMCAAVVGATLGMFLLRVTRPTARRQPPTQ